MCKIFLSSLTHLTKEEFSRRLLPDSILSKVNPEPASQNYSGKVPSYFDWRSNGVVTSVKDQRDCGDCYAFAAAAAVESHHAIKTRTKVDLSEQEILDCDNQSKGCNWGYLYTALDYSRNVGLVHASSYPYEDRKGSCRIPNGEKIKIIGHQWLSKDENVIANAVYNNGPVPFIMTNPSALQHYTGGIFSMDAGTCKSQSVGNHIPVIVGFGSDYWIVKNSWGTNWGENGYFRLKRGSNACDVTMEARSIY